MDGESEGNEKLRLHLVCSHNWYYMVLVQNTCPQNDHKVGSLLGSKPLLSKCIPDGPLLEKDL